jgi:cadmium resistance protein CadD (predicted permease)
MRARRDLAQKLPRVRTMVLVLGAVYVAVAMCFVPFPFVDLLALLPGALGVWALIYFTRPATRAVFESGGVAQPEAAPPAS